MSDHVPPPSSPDPPSSPAKSSPVVERKGTLYERGWTLFFRLGVAYVVIVALFAIPYFQTHAIYLHAIKYPFFSKYDSPELYGLSPHKTINVKIHTSDNQTLGAWFTFSESYHRTNPPSITSDDPSTMQTIHAARISEALKQSPTVLFLHGNAATRALSDRVRHYQMYSNKLNYNVLAVDYRGFGESSGVPTEDGVTRDSHAAFEWLTDTHGARKSDVIVVGHSLGTGIASRLVYELEAEPASADDGGGGEGEGDRVGGLVLLAPFSSIRTLLDTYHILGFFPLMTPLAMIPKAPELVTSALIHKFDTLSFFPNITTPTLIAHAEDDWDIPFTHSYVLFDAVVESYLPPLSITSVTSGNWLVYQSGKEKRDLMLSELVEEEDKGAFGVVRKMERGVMQSKRLRLVKAAKGGHNRVGIQEGVLDEMRTFFEAGFTRRRVRKSEFVW